MAAFLVGAAVSAGAQVPVVYPRDTAASELGDQIPVWETHIAAGFNQVVAVFNQGMRIPCRVGYAVYDRAEETWSQATVAGDHHAIDPSIAFDHPARLSIPGDGPLSPPPDTFVAAALNSDDNQIVVSRYAEGAFETWRAAVDWPDDDPPDDYYVDKPWIVPGEVDSVHREYYIVYWHAPPDTDKGYAYLRSTNSAEDWFPPSWDHPDDNGMIKVNGERVTGGFCAQPAVWGDEPLYIAYPTVGVFRFLRGDDRVEDGGVNFSYLETTSGILELARNRSNIEDYLPEIPHDSVQVTAVVPQLAVDPGDPDRLYVVYNDTATAEGEGSTDVNIYLRVLTRSGGYWAADDRILVNNDDTDFESDQFRPAVTVDTQGYIHILFYDDREYTDPDPNDPQEDQQPDGSADAKFDAFYAYAPLDDLDFQSDPEQNRELYAVPAEPAVDGELNLWKGYELGEYNGITSFFGAGRHEVWTSFSGTKAGDPSPDKTVIYSSFIEW